MAGISTPICNLALSHIGIAKEVANVETEKSAEASACRRYYEDARDQVLRDFAWPFASRIAPLGLVAEAPNDDWDFSYRYPSNCLLIRRILSGIRPDNTDSRIPYKIGGDDQGELIWTDEEDAEAEYTIKETDATRFPADFKMAFSLLLASYIAPRLTRGDPTKLRERNLSLYQVAISKAKATSVNEQQDDRDPDAEFIRARE